MQLKVVLGALLGASAALAAPRAGRPASRRALSSSFASQPRITNTTDADYSPNWSGAVLIGSGYTSVTGTIVVPTIAASSGSTTRCKWPRNRLNCLRCLTMNAIDGSAWVGIDGDTCRTALWQTGIAWQVTGSQVTYDAWYEWVPEGASSESLTSLQSDLLTATM